MTTNLKKKILSELDSFPDTKINSLLDYILFLKFEETIKIPNKTTEKTFMDSDEGKNLNSYSSPDEFFAKMDSQLNA